MPLPKTHFTDPFSDHQITRLSLDSLLLKNPHRSAYWTTIARTDGGHLMVNGDIAMMCFGSNSDTNTLLGLIQWMGSHDGVDGYVAQKAKIGMMPYNIYERTAEQWKIDVLEVFRSVCENAGEPGDQAHDELAPKLTWKLYTQEVDSEVLGSVAGRHVEGTQELLQFLTDQGVSDAYEYVADLGTTLGPQVRFAHAAVCRAYALLQESGAYSETQTQDLPQ